MCHDLKIAYGVKEGADLLAVIIVVFCHFPKCVLVHIRIKGEVGAVKLA